MRHEARGSAPEGELAGDSLQNLPKRRRCLDAAAGPMVRDNGLPAAFTNVVATAGSGAAISSTHARSSDRKAVSNALVMGFSQPCLRVGETVAPSAVAVAAS